MSFSLLFLNKDISFTILFSVFDFFKFFSRFFYRSSSAYITGLPPRSCQTIGAPSVQGSAQSLYFRFWLQQDSNPRPGAYNDVLIVETNGRNHISDFYLGPRYDFMKCRKLSLKRCVKVTSFSYVISPLATSGGR